jgi:hypothetical protein
MEHLTVQVSEMIHAPIQKVFDFIVDPTQTPKAMSGSIENSNISELPLKEGSTYNYKYKMLGVTLDGVWEVKQIDSPKMYSARTLGDAESEWNYELYEDAGVTYITLTVTYKPPHTVAEQVKMAAMIKVNELEAKNFLHNLKVLTEEV